MNKTTFTSASSSSVNASANASSVTISFNGDGDIDAVRIETVQIESAKITRSIQAGSFDSYDVPDLNNLQKPQTKLSPEHKRLRNTLFEKNRQRLENAANIVGADLVQSKSALAVLDSKRDVNKCELVKEFARKRAALEQKYKRQLAALDTEFAERDSQLGLTFAEESLVLLRRIEEAKNALEYIQHKRKAGGYC